MSEANDPYVITSLKRGIQVIDSFARRDSWSLAELTVELSQSKATLFRILHTLEDGEYVKKDRGTGRYSLGMRLYSLGNIVLRHEQLRWEALPPLQDLAEQTGETVYVGILHDGMAVAVQVVDGTRVVRMHAFVGKRSPAHASALGKVLLAHLPDADVDLYVATYGLKTFTANTIADAATLKEELKRIRERGYALDAEEMELGLKCIGAPITDHTGRPFATVSISGPSARMSEEQTETLIPLLKTTALQISRMLGGPSLITERLVAAA